MPDEVKLEPWPLFGYAPGNYSISCYRCKAEAHDCDKRAIACLPCAVEQAKLHIAAIEATRPTAATDDVVKELRRLVDEWDGTKEFNADDLYLFTEALVGAVRTALARTGVTLNG